MVAIAICIVGSVTMYAQDIIILKNGNEIQSVVQEVGTNEIKYKRFDNQNGPNYILNKSEVFMIKYENGSKDVFNEIVSPDTVPQQQGAVNQQSSYLNSNSNSQQQQFLIQKYTFGKQISPYGSEKNQFLAGFLSFLIPGVGQFYNGDIGGGFLFLGCNFLCNTLWMNSMETDYYGNASINGSQFAIGFIGALVVNISSIVHATRGAKKVNIARGYRLADNTYLKIEPTIIQQNKLFASKEYAYGMNFRISF